MKEIRETPTLRQALRRSHYRAFYKKRVFVNVDNILHHEPEGFRIPLTDEGLAFSEALLGKEPKLME